MKRTFVINRPRGLWTIKTACLFILMTTLLANSFSAFAAIGCKPAKSKSGDSGAKSGDSGAKSGDSGTKSKKPAATATTTNTSKTVLRLNTVAVVVGSKVTQTQVLTERNQPVYYLVNDTNPRSPTCSPTLNTGPMMMCTQKWEPLLQLPDNSLRVDGLPCKLTVTQNVNGQQVSCNDHPLYINVKDLTLIATGVDDHWQLVTSSAPVAGDDPSSVKVSASPPGDPSSVKVSTSPSGDAKPKSPSGDAKPTPSSGNEKPSSITAVDGGKPKTSSS